MIIVKMHTPCHFKVVEFSKVVQVLRECKVEEVVGL